MRGTSTHLIKMTGIGLALRVLKVSRDQLLVLEMRSTKSSRIGVGVQVFFQNNEHVDADTVTRVV